MADLLLELFSEEIPARMQPRARADLQKLITDGLVEAGLTYGAAQAFFHPRRLTLAVQGLSARSPDLREDRKGPRTDAPDAAIEGFLRSTGVSRDALEVRDEKKGQVYFAVIARPGRPAPEIVAEVVDRVIRTFPWPKSMRWGAGSLRWVRPLQSILCILSDEAGTEVVPFTVDEIVAGDVTRGHRFMAPDAFSVANFDDYAAKLKRAFVVLDAEERAGHIEAEAQAMAFALGLEVVPDAGLLAEVAGLVEWPVVLMGEIGRDFMGLPPEVLQTSMREHQKFFSVRDPKTGQILRFVTVANRDTADGGATILAGNGKVLAARLLDAKFFWNNDLRVVSDVGLEGMGAGLAQVTFHNKLGSQAARVERIAALAREIAPLVGADPDEAALAARVAKADLRSEMVGEFPELQGVMGGYYARAAGLSDAVAAACREHYQPLGPSDNVPTAPVSVAVALAEKIDILAVFWHLNEKPTGSKDPFALRRAAIGLTKLVEVNSLRLSLKEVLPAAFRRVAADNIVVLADMTAKDRYIPYPLASGRDLIMPILHDLDSWQEDDLLVELFSSAFEWELNQLEAVEFALKAKSTIFAGSPELTTDLLAFFHDRLKVYLRDHGIRHDVIDACLAMPGNDDLTLLVKRAEALAAFLKTEEGPNLLQGFKRANKLWMDEMKKLGFEDDLTFLKAISVLESAEAADGVEYSYGPDPKFFEHDSETALFHALDAAEAAILPAMKAEDFAAAMRAMAALRAPIDAFFDAVQINSDNAILRRNRLNLLHRIRATCGSVADLTRLEG